MNKQQAAASHIRTLPIIISFITAGFIGLFSETALNMALRSLTLDFGIEATTAQWLTTGYLLTLGILVPISGLILQWFTTRQLFITSLIFSIIGTFIAAVAPVFSILMVARVVQAVGTALLLPLMFNTILVIIPPHKRGRSMGIIGLVIMFAPAVGPTVSGLILKSLTWHWIFWISLPLLIAALVFGFIFMQNITEPTRPKIDILSIVLSTIGFGGIVYGFSSAGEGGGWSSMHVIVAIVVGVIGILVFSLRQLNMKEPMLNLSPFKYPMFVIGLLLILVCMMVMLSAMMILPLYLQTSLALTTFTAGLMLLPYGIINGLLSPIMGGLFDKFGPKWLVIGACHCRSDDVWLHEFKCEYIDWIHCDPSYYVNGRNRDDHDACTNKWIKSAAARAISAWYSDYEYIAAGVRSYWYCGRYFDPFIRDPQLYGKCG